MSLTGYLTKSRRQRQRLLENATSPVLSGENDLAERLEQQALEALRRTPPDKLEQYDSVDDYDPVLRTHCRLD